MGGSEPVVRGIPRRCTRSPRYLRREPPVARRDRAEYGADFGGHWMFCDAIALTLRLASAIGWKGEDGAARMADF